ncbi:MAG: hypothetical protein QOJ63_1062 [Solirubrobacteraceae bacterium]|nr:hypothetical protein [Solirubrobacteraceae bacterium]
MAGTLTLRHVRGAASGGAADARSRQTEARARLATRSVAKLVRR